ncbi:hypothetical protein [Pantoea agglomerans]|uniref:hypothetical protein n=1 Tax=Enterobacter agglomerans TaxID=549 RepID=UPI002780DDF2|nr:hypothetical protein [Pantoea agglomerans]MDQ0435628.1 hypothetical protein [Pantoea agglomerans]
MRQLTRTEWASSFIRRALRPAESEVPISSIMEILTIGPTFLRQILDEQGFEYTDTTIFAEWTVDLGGNAE